MAMCLLVRFVSSVIASTTLIGSSEHLYPHPFRKPKAGDSPTTEPNSALSYSDSMSLTVKVNWRNDSWLWESLHDKDGDPIHIVIRVVARSGQGPSLD